MPGIAGIISRTPRKENEKNIRHMINCMMHESFYSSGIFINQELGLYSGWVCHEGSFSDCMPVINEKKNLALIFFGENFTDKELFDQLKAKYHKFDASNASYLIHLYEEKGIDFLKDLNGWFSGILVDIQEGKVVLFNDRYGMQRIYYHESKDAFLFSSEAKSLFKVCPELREIDLKSLGEYFCCECVLENRSLFKNIFLLPSAAQWTFCNGTSPKKDHYFSPDIWENQPSLDNELFYTRLKETFSRILPRYFRSNQQIGISLTGGLDTRMILACTDIPPEKYPCYTFSGMYRENFDVKIAHKVADAIHQKHHIIRLDRDFLSDFPKYAEKTIYATDGYMDLNGTPEVYINKLAREIAPIRMTGNYGSEVLRSIRWLKAILPNESIFNSDFKSQLQEATITLTNINLNFSNPLSFTLFKEAPWHGYGRIAIEQSQLSTRTPYMDNDLVELMYRAPTGVRNTSEISLRLIADGNQSLSEIMTDRGVGGKTKFPFSILAHLYYEFLFKAEYVYNYGMPQWLAKFDYTFKQMHIERFFLGRHKFYHFRIWYRDELADYVREMLLDDRTASRPYLNKKVLEEMVDSHTAGYKNYTNAITKILTVELIQRLLIEQK